MQREEGSVEIEKANANGLLVAKSVTGARVGGRRRVTCDVHILQRFFCMEGSTSVFEMQMAVRHYEVYLHFLYCNISLSYFGDFV